jgi:L,D-peptidoglycan transpeptidase YkuD (ErfK/YbiS/YcfS/YnhG family)
MHILIKNKKLFMSNYKVKCAVGKRGIGAKKKEGDLITPQGKFKINYILYRKDRIYNLKSKIKIFPIKKDMGWCNDTLSQKYNKLIKFPFKYGAEKLYRVDNSYDIILVLNFNSNPVIKNKGSAIFIHVAKKKYKKTAGCIALKKKDLKNIIRLINSKTIIKIS